MRSRRRRPGSVRHFGVTLARDDFDALVARLAAQRGAVGGRR